MEGATHYIEVWKGNGDDVVNSMMLPISHMFLMLRYSEQVGVATIAIFKIKLKP